MSRPKTSKPCPHSPSCFTCPLKECPIGAAKAGYYNVLPYEHEIMDMLNRRASRKGVRSA